MFKFFDPGNIPDGILVYDARHYDQILKMTEFPSEFFLGDNIEGFDSKFQNRLLSHISKNVKQKTTVWNDQIFVEPIHQNYPNLELKLAFPAPIWRFFIDHKTHPELNFKNCVCSFNGSAHVGRKLLVSTLHKFNLFDPSYSSKVFTLDSASLSGHLQDLVPDQERFYSKFFSFDETFLNTQYNFDYKQRDHTHNLNTLESRITQSFVNIASESMATSYQPFVGEKFALSVVTRGLFITHGQPGWHDHLEKYYGFKKYDKIFDYRFDHIANPVERLVEMVTMISKFSHLTPAEWHDLYLLEQDTIEFNYDHYFSKGYLNCLRQHQLIS